MKEFLNWSIGRLNQAGIDSPRMEAEVLFTGALKLGREEILNSISLQINSRKV